MSSIKQEDSYDVNSSRTPVPEQSGATGRFLPSAKLMEKLNKLAEWRIDPSLIEFPKNATELQGGHATVERALLKIPSNKSGNMGKLDPGQKVVALKKLRKTADQDLERVLGLTLREAGMLVELYNGHIVELEGFVEDVSRGTIWLVFPWEANGNLRDFIGSRDWEIPERISLINCVTMGVGYLHSRKPPICHGDLKSINILVNSSCHALITDFGSARRLTEPNLDAETEQPKNQKQRGPRLEATFCASTNTITLTGNEFTLRWAAPELLNDEPSTPKVDIWALGWIAYEVMTNAIPFEDVAKESIVIRRVTQGHLPSITGDARMSLMRQLCTLMSECWSIDPSQRPTAVACRKSLHWMPMIVPNPNRTTAPTLPEARSPNLLLRLGDMYRDQDDYAKASKLYNEAMRIFTDAADTKGTAGALLCLAQLHLFQDKEEEAIAAYSEALEIFTSYDDSQMTAEALLGLARAYKSQEELGKAATFYSEALEITADLDENSERASALFGLAEIHRLRREYGQAIPLYTEALRIYTDIRERQGRASSLWGLAQAHRLQHQYDQAITFYSDALQIYTDIGDSRGRGFALVGLADVSSDQGRPNDAIDLYKQALEIYAHIGASDLAVHASIRAARARQQLERAEDTI